MPHDAARCHTMPHDATRCHTRWINRSSERHADGQPSRLRDEPDNLACAAPARRLGDGPVLQVFFTDRTPHRNHRDLMQADKKKAIAFGNGLIRPGIYCTPGGKLYLPLAHTGEVLAECDVSSLETDLWMVSFPQPQLASSRGKRRRIALADEGAPEQRIRVAGFESQLRLAQGFGPWLAIEETAIEIFHQFLGLLVRNFP
jgi:hypothetical protein